MTGVLTGQPLSHEMYIKLPGADVVLLTEGNIIGCDTASATWTRRGLRPGMSIRSLRGNREISPLTICQCRRWPAPGRRGVIAGDVRRGEVGLAHSSGEAGEQPERSGVSGAKERVMGTRNSHTCAGHRAGKACHRGCHACGKLRSSGRKNGLQHCSTC